MAERGEVDGTQDALKEAARYAQRREDAQRGDERWRAVLDSGMVTDVYPTLNRMERAAGAFRRGLAEK